MTRLIDADALAKVKFHGYPEIEITPSDVNAEAYKRGWNDAIDAIIESGPSIDIEDIIVSHEEIGYERGLRDGYAQAVTESDATERWIPCSERLPEESGRYLVTRGLNACGSLWNRIYIANYSDLMGIKSKRIWWKGNVGKSDFERLDDVLAWMPLPKPY